jgi:hypothetical protein
MPTISSRISTPRWKRCEDYFSSPTRDVVARLDRATQYSREVGSSETPLEYWMPRLKRGMTAELTRLRILAVELARGLQIETLIEIRRRREDRMLVAPAASCAVKKAHE